MSNLFKAEHPFSNYWTHQGGLPEVIGVLPSREQADILVSKYFHAVDPVYPMIHRETFENDYNHFWMLNPTERSATDASLVALIFVMLAMGTQFVDLPSMEEKEQTAEFYGTSTMVLITYFLMNDNHASDAWAFAGILQRQAYALGLNRDPSIVQPNAHPLEMQQRRKVWQAVFIQDTFLSVIIKLPPTVTHNDVRIEDLLETEDSYFEHGATDTSFIRSMWTLASVVQDQHEEMACDIRATLEAAHEAIASFFLFHTIFDGEAGVWFHFQHRAFSEALMIADLVKSKPPESTMDSVYVQGKTDLIKMVGMMQMNSEHDIVARTRMGVLSSYL
ncbi:MAG: hypothetical protein LQ350_007585 [Teloschistes chrysophthalmus]|nr:MAG: hypothetical protein LQ350_007585 [Niorma chrysophthalma]